MIGFVEFLFQGLWRRLLWLFNFGKGLFSIVDCIMGNFGCLCDWQRLLNGSKGDFIVGVVKDVLKRGLFVGGKIILCFI